MRSLLVVLDSHHVNSRRGHLGKITNVEFIFGTYWITVEYPLHNSTIKEDLDSTSDRIKPIHSDRYGIPTGTSCQIFTENCSNETEWVQGKILACSSEGVICERLDEQENHVILSYTSDRLIILNAMFILTHSRIQYQNIHLILDLDFIIGISIEARIINLT